MFFEPAPERRQVDYNLVAPPGIDIKANITAAQSMNAREFYDAVKTDGVFDYKKGGSSEYENFGNYHFGILAAAVGISADDPVVGAGLYQIKLDTTPRTGVYPHLILRNLISVVRASLRSTTHPITVVIVSRGVFGRLRLATN